jgi:hypothetical protein
VTLVQSLTGAVASVAPALAATSPTGAAVSGALVYALARWTTGRQPGR